MRYRVLCLSGYNSRLDDGQYGHEISGVGGGSLSVCLQIASPGIRAKQLAVEGWFN